MQAPGDTVCIQGRCTGLWVNVKMEDCVLTAATGHGEPLYYPESESYGVIVRFKRAGGRSGSRVSFTLYPLLFTLASVVAVGCASIFARTESVDHQDRTGAAPNGSGNITGMFCGACRKCGYDLLAHSRTLPGAWD